ncbi:hypothetical protein TcWFU_002130 [Taenia crassiceps]|uniref:Uncharacterized protein n=1 Tax=Taenia crassiceps TaxID=6207 RepID=A0ABR4QFZ0_9CEST
MRVSERPVRGQASSLDSPVLLGSRSFQVKVCCEAFYDREQLMDGRLLVGVVYEHAKSIVDWSDVNSRKRTGSLQRLISRPDLSKQRSWSRRLDALHKRQ